MFHDASCTCVGKVVMTPKEYKTGGGEFHKTRISVVTVTKGGTYTDEWFVDMHSNIPDSIREKIEKDIIIVVKGKLQTFVRNGTSETFIKAIDVYVPNIYKKDIQLDAFDEMDTKLKDIGN